MTAGVESCDALPMNCDEAAGDRGRLWFPFTTTEFEVALGLLGLLITALSLTDIGREVTLCVAAGFAIATYLAGLLVRAQASAAAFRFVENGGMRGVAYIDAVRRAKKSLLLQHVDDDAPSDELLGLYRTLLERGVFLRRTVFLRPDSRPEGLRWIRDFGTHANLEQRLVLPEQAQLQRWSFVVVDEREVVISMPGTSALDTETYNSSVVLRHAMVLRDRAVAAAFVRIHEHAWRQAIPVEDPAAFAELEQLARGVARSTSTTTASRTLSPRDAEARSAKPRALQRP